MIPMAIVFTVVFRYLYSRKLNRLFLKKEGETHKIVLDMLGYAAGKNVNHRSTTNNNN